MLRYAGYFFSSHIRLQYQPHFQAEDRLFHVPAEWLTPSSKFTLLYRSFISEAPESNEGQLPAKGSLEYSEPIRARGAEEDDWPMFLLGVKATELFAFLRVLDPQ